MIYEVIIVFLLAIICFLLYQLYRIKYTGLSKNEFIPESLKKDLMNLEEGVGKDRELEEINSRISELQERIEQNERVVEKLVKELS